MIIYLLTNTLDGKRYVGQTRSSLGKRMSAHRSDARAGRTSPINRAIATDGWDAFEVQVIAEYDDQAQTDLAEQKTIIDYDCMYPRGYNTHIGGNSPPVKSAETRAKIAAAKKGRKHSQATRELISQAGRGRKAGEATRAKMSASASSYVRKKGYKQTPEHIAKRFANRRAKVST